MANNKEIIPLTGLRFATAFYVFLFHIQIRWPLTGNYYLQNILNQGAVAMSMFFMLSGFVLAYQYSTSKHSIKEYFTNRFARIYPIYISAAIFTLPWISINRESYTFLDSVKYIARITTIVLSNIFLLQAWIPQFFSYWNDGASWSISVEGFCYLLLPVILRTAANLSQRKIIYTIILCWAMTSLPGITANLFDAPTINIFYSLPIYRLPEFSIGVCVLLLAKSQKKFQKNSISITVLVLSFFGYMAINGKDMPIYIGHNFIIIPIFGAILYNLATEKSYISSILSFRPIVWLGKISYCFYSFQAVVILTILNYHDLMIKTIPILRNSKVLMLSALTVLVAISALGYYFIEEPARKMIRRHSTDHSFIKKRLT